MGEGHCCQFAGNVKMSLQSELAIPKFVFLFIACIAKIGY